MKKLLSVFLILLLICGCEKQPEEVKYTYDIVSKNVDMSAYEGVTSTGHNFRLITVSELFNTIDQGSSGVFYLGRDNCACCQSICRYLNEAALETGVTVYYIDVYNEDEPLTDQEVQDRLFEYLYPILGKDEEGNKSLLTPHVFAVINGEFYKSQICFDGLDFNYDPTPQQIEKLKDVYRAIMKPFAQS